MRKKMGLEEEEEAEVEDAGEEGWCGGGAVRVGASQEAFSCRQRSFGTGGVARTAEVTTQHRCRGE